MNDINVKMDNILRNLEERFSTVRAGRANPSMLKGIEVMCYGVNTPIQSIANITIPEARQLMIKPFDRTNIKEIEKAINEANLGITPTNNGEVVILTIPLLTEERRKEYVKHVKTFAEDARVAIRNVRQDENNAIKKEEFPEDKEKLLMEEVQDVVNEYNKKVEDKLKEKEEELMQV